MTYRHSIFFPNKLYAIYECTPELAVTVAAAHRTIYCKEDKTICVYTHIYKYFTIQLHSQNFSVQL